MSRRSSDMASNNQSVPAAVYQVHIPSTVPHSVENGEPNDRGNSVPKSVASPPANPNIKIIIKPQIQPSATSTPKTFDQARTQEDNVSLKEFMPSKSLEDIRKLEKSPEVEEHGKSRCSTPRELLQLQKSVNDSKILTEYKMSNCKFRKSKKVPLKTGDEPSTALKITTARPRSVSCSRPRDGRSSTELKRWPSEEKLCKRDNMRSQNSEFAQKHFKFLKSVNQEAAELSEHSDDGLSVNESISTVSASTSSHEIGKGWQPPPKPGWDSFCWKCHKSGEVIPCTRCVRSYHVRCVKSQGPAKDKPWICPECVALENFKNKPGKTYLPQDHLNQLLQFALTRMRLITGYDNFTKPDYLNDPHLKRFIVQPVTLKTMQEKIEKRQYKYSEEFAIDGKWILHNTIIIYGANDKLTKIAKNLQKVSRQEPTEIEICSDCYYNANIRKDWFIEVCSKPHILLWAKLKGFPFWPGKAIDFQPPSHVKVRFFGEHDASVIPLRDCYLFSKTDPNTATGKRSNRNMLTCMGEVEAHINKLREKIGEFVHAPYKVQYLPQRQHEQLEEMMPGVTEYIKKQAELQKSPLTFKIVKTADNNMSIIKKNEEPAASNDDEELDKILKVKKISQSKRKSVNYEVVSSSPTQSGDGSTKVVSMILKRKAETEVEVHENVKKTKSVEESERKTSNKRLSSSSSSNKTIGEDAKKVKVDESTTARPNIEDLVKAKDVTITKISKEEYNSKTRKYQSESDAVKEDKLDEPAQSSSAKQKGTPLRIVKDLRELVPFQIKVENEETEPSPNAPSKPAPVDEDKQPETESDYYNLLDVKEEPFSDDEDNDADSDGIRRVGETVIQRISVKEISTLQKQPTPTATPPRADQRARKTFINKNPLQCVPPLVATSAALRPALAVNSNTKDSQPQQSMVVIPRNDSIPIPPLTTVSKPLNQPATTSAVSIAQTPATPLASFVAATTVASTAPSSSVPTLSSSTSFVSPPSSSMPIQSQESNPPQNQITSEESPTPPPPPPPITETFSNVKDHMLCDLVTPALAAAVTDAMVRPPPKLAPRPSSALRAEGHFVFPPNPNKVSQTLESNSHKMADFFRSVIEDTIGDMAASGILEAKVKMQQMEMEKMKHEYERQIMELKHNTDVMLAEMRKSMEKEKALVVAETRKHCELLRHKAIEETKRKQWCTICMKQAQFYCCWNTSYCSYTCQQKHWPTHMTSCEQIPKQSNETNPVAPVFTMPSGMPMRPNEPGTSTSRPGVKISSYNMKDKSPIPMTSVRPSPKEILPKLPPNTFIRPATIVTSHPAPSVPIVQPVNAPPVGPVQSAIRGQPVFFTLPNTAIQPSSFALVQREGRFELVTANGTTPQQMNN